MQQVTLGQKLRDSQLDFFQVRDADFLASCRTLAVEVCQQVGTVSINDIRAAIPLPIGTHPSVFGAVFKDKRFKACGYTEATHPQAHARVVRVYQLTNKE